MSRENFKFSCHLKFIKESDLRQAEFKKDAQQEEEEEKFSFDGLKSEKASEKNESIGKMSC